MSTTFNGGVTINGKVYVRALAAPPPPVGCTDDPAPDWAGVGPTVEGTYSVTGAAAPTTNLGKNETFYKNTTAVSTNRDATIAVAGDSGYSNSPYTNDGAAFVFTGSGSPRNFTSDTTGTPSAVLTSSTPETNGRFGEVAEISSDGLIIAINAPGEDGTPPYVEGTVHVFEDVAGTWTHRSVLTYQNSEGSGRGSVKFGVSIALTEDGAGILVGVRNANGGAGEVEIWERVGDAWTYTDTLLSDAVGVNGFGVSVDISHDGTAAVIGTDTSTSTLARVYTFSGVDIGTLGSRVSILQPIESGNDISWGSSVAISGDGTTFVAGHCTSAGNTPYGGTTQIGGGFSVYTFPTTYIETIETVSDTMISNYAYLGYDVRISDTGQVIAATAPKASISGSYTYDGASYIYIKDTGAWVAERQVSLGAPYAEVGLYSFDLNDCGGVVSVSQTNNTIKTFTL